MQTRLPCADSLYFVRPSLRHLKLFKIARKPSTPAELNVEHIEDVLAPNILRATQHHAV